MFRLPALYWEKLGEAYRRHRRPVGVAGKPLAFSVPRLVTSLDYFIEDALGSLNPSLFRYYSAKATYKRYGKDNLYRAIQSEDPYWNPTRELVDLLCYYVFNVSYENAVRASLLPDNLRAYANLKSQSGVKGSSTLKAQKHAPIIVIDVVLRNREIEQAILERSSEQVKDTIKELKQLIRDACQSEMNAYKAVPLVDLKEVAKRYKYNSPAYHLISDYVEDKKKKGLALHKKTATFEFYDITLTELTRDKATFESVEYWLLRWYDKQLDRYPPEETYKVKNRQTYTIIRSRGTWRISNVFFPEYDNC